MHDDKVIADVAQTLVGMTIIENLKSEYMKELHQLRSRYKDTLLTLIGQAMHKG